MNQVIKDLKSLLKQQPSWGLQDRLEKYVLQLEKDNKEAINDKSKRTGSQNSSIHVFCKLLAESLNDAGLPMNKLLKVDIDWSMEAVKTHIWKPIMKALYQKDSTTKLKKQKEIDKIHEIIMRELGEKHHIEYIPFPSKTVVTTENDYINEANKLRQTYEQ